MLRLIGSDGNGIGKKSDKFALNPTCTLCLKKAGELNSNISLSVDAIPSAVCTEFLNAMALLVWSYQITGIYVMSS